MALAWPIILANVATPLLGLVDTAVIGNLGSAADLGAIALGGLLFNFIYWSFGFLRMGTSGFTAQAVGAGDEVEVRATLARAVLLALAIGTALVALQAVIGAAAWRVFDAGDAVESVAAHYFAIRIWGAPAALSLYAIFGCWIGMGRSRLLLLAQVGMNGLNVVLDLVFAAGLGWGVGGIALGTAVAEWVTLGFAAWMLLHDLRRQRKDDGAFWPRERIADWRRAVRILRANADIMVRTLTLLLAFGWFTNQSARFGDAVLGANHILLQLISFSAFFLDGYAFAAEALVGQAIGAGHLRRFDAAVRRSSELALLTALGLCGSVMLAGGWMVDRLTDLESVRAVARASLPWCASYVLLSAAAFQLDGIFIGATRTRDMRNAGLLASALFVAGGMLLVPVFGNDGLWMAFNAYVVLRALTLMRYWPKLRQEIRGG